MIELNIEKFEPWKAELIALAEKYKDLQINWLSDKEWYESVRKWRIELMRCRTAITKMWKEMREEANEFRNKVIAKEKEYIEIISPIEDMLSEKEKEYLELVDIEKRKENLPIRRAMLEWLSDISDENILTYNDKAFAELLVVLKQAKIDEERRKLEEEKAEFQRKQLEAEAEAKRMKDIADAEEKVRNEEKLKAEREIQRLKDEAEAKRIADEKAKEAEKYREEEKARQEKIEAERIRKNKQYKQFLTDNNYNELTDKVEKEWEQFTIYRAIAKITIN